MNHRRTTVLAVITTLAFVTIGCSVKGPTATQQRTYGTQPRFRPGSETTLDLPQGEPRSIQLADGSSMKIVLPPDATIEQRTSNPDTTTLNITLSDTSLGFPIGEATPTDEQQAVDQVQQFLTSASESGHEIVSITVKAWASIEGDTESNNRLSTARANWMCQTLEAIGVDPRTVTCSGEGEHDIDPIGPGPEDRRVELQVSMSSSR